MSRRNADAFLKDHFSFGGGAICVGKAAKGSSALIENRWGNSMRTVQVILVLILSALAGGAIADDPGIGGWRNLGLRPEIELNGSKSAFAILPYQAALGARFSVLDRGQWRAVCCVEVVSPPLSEASLSGSYRVPSVWALDMTYNWNENPSFKSYVFALKKVGDLASHGFSGAHYDSGEWGGLLLPEDARTGMTGKVVMSGKRYSVQIDSEETADGDGVTERYLLAPDSGGSALQQSVRFTNY